jgi:YidC/Oxa1 family membrane protein insertase
VYEAHIPSTDDASGSGSNVTASGAAVAQVDHVARFQISEPGPITKLFRTFITAPFLNFLIFIASLVPSHDLGLAIIILTIVVKIVLFFPTKKALEGQKKMQLLQPKLEALKKQYGSDQQKLNEETMKLWKDHKINPFSACLPTLLQFPILIGLFYVIRDGSHLEVSRHLIYPMYQNLPWTFDTFFLGLDLLKPSIYIMPPLLFAMQFIQMKLSFAINARKKAGKKDDVIDVGAKEKKPADPQALQQQIMLYGLPLMIAVFAFQFPAAVSLYWGVSTLFSIGQQILVNREHIRP